MNIRYIPSEAGILIFRPYYNNGSLSMSNILEYFNTNSRLDLLKEICNKLSEFHNSNLIHGNLKPSNILIDDDNHYILTDYFHILLKYSPVTSSNIRLSNYRYKSPELLKDEEYDVSTDIWSFGCILYYIYTGKPLFPEKNIEKLFEHICSGKYENIKSLKSNKCNEIINKLLATSICVETEDRLSIDDILHQLNEIKSYDNIDELNITVSRNRNNSCDVIVDNDGDDENNVLISPSGDDNNNESFISSPNKSLKSSLYSSIKKSEMKSIDSKMLNIPSMLLLLLLLYSWIITRNT